jgi:pimeloyl-ACP methyl ester carboxylesterase
MTTFVLIPGAGGAAWYWHRVLPLLRQAGHEALAVDLPGDDAHAGLHAYADLVVAAIGNGRDVTLVAQSMGAFTAALVCARTSIRMLAFVNAMIPLPGETAGEWWDHTGWVEARKAAAKGGGYSLEHDGFKFGHNQRLRSSWRTRSVRRSSGSARSPGRLPRLFAVRLCAASV